MNKIVRKNQINPKYRRKGKEYMKPQQSLRRLWKQQRKDRRNLVSLKVGGLSGSNNHTICRILTT